MQAFLRGSSCLEETKTSKRRTFLGSDYGAVSTRVEVDA